MRKIWVVLFAAVCLLAAGCASCSPRGEPKVYKYHSEGRLDH